MLISEFFGHVHFLVDVQTFFSGLDFGQKNFARRSSNKEQEITRNTKQEARNKKKEETQKQQKKKKQDIRPPYTTLIPDRPASGGPSMSINTHEL